jgi:predicted AAA+ superfamily ATPase
MIRNGIFQQLKTHLEGRRRFIQVISGPRQVGKTTLARQAMQALDVPSHYASADAPTLEGHAWIETQWEIGRSAARQAGRKGALLVLDEVQKVPRWSETVKALWDADTATGMPHKVLLLGSSPLLVGRGLSESLAGRFELIRAGHWSFSEMREAFGWDLDQYLFFGGYPGAAALVEDEGRWRQYVADSLVETTISRDILLLTRVDKPALLRRLFQLGLSYSGQILSYQKMLGQLQDAGNTTTLAHYLDLLGGAGFISGLQKYSGRQVQRRGSSPKLLALNTALVTASSGLTFKVARKDHALWGRLVETAVGAHLVNGTQGTPVQVGYWLDRNREVDFVLSAPGATVAIEVKSGRVPTTLPGLETFRKAYPKSKTLLVGEGGVPLEEFLTSDPDRWLGSGKP